MPASLIGLCRAYLAEVANHPGKAVDSTAFRTLIVAAGSEKKVTKFCQALLPSPTGSGEGSTGQDSRHPTKSPRSRSNVAGVGT